MLTLVLAESEVELIPASILTNPRVVSSAQRRGKPPRELLLESSIHHGAMGSLPEFERRGRPDIMHLVLLVSLESILNKQHQLRLIVHTRNDEQITIDPSTRIIKHYDRFLGLIEQLFVKQVLPDEDNPLLELTPHCSLEHILDKLETDYKVACSSTGKPVNLPLFFSNLKKKHKHNITIVVGGFPHGDFHSDIKTMVDDVISIYPEMVPAWTVVSELCVNYENLFVSKPL